MYRKNTRCCRTYIPLNRLRSQETLLRHSVARSFADARLRRANSPRFEDRLGVRLLQRTTTAAERVALHGNAIAQDRLARILSAGRGAPADPVEARKWHLVSKARGETDLMLDDFVANLDAATRAAGEKAAKPWLDAIKKPPS